MQALEPHMERGRMGIRNPQGFHRHLNGAALLLLGKVTFKASQSASPLSQQNKRVWFRACHSPKAHCSYMSFILAGRRLLPVFNLPKSSQGTA